MKHIITIAAIALAGCAAQPVQFVKDGAAPDDRTICEAQARAAAAPVANGFFALDAMRDTFRACMVGRGYTMK